MAQDPVEARPPDGATPVVHVHVKVVPGSARNALAGRYGDRLKIRVTAPPESGKANAAVLDFLATYLGIPNSAVRLARGDTMPLKTIEVRGMDAAAVGRILYGSP